MIDKKPFQFIIKEKLIFEYYLSGNTAREIVY